MLIWVLLLPSSNTFVLFCYTNSLLLLLFLCVEGLRPNPALLFCTFNDLIFEALSPRSSLARTGVIITLGRRFGNGSGTGVSDAMVDVG